MSQQKAVLKAAGAGVPLKKKLLSSKKDEFLDDVEIENPLDFGIN